MLVAEIINIYLEWFANSFPDCIIKFNEQQKTYKLYIIRKTERKQDKFILYIFDMELNRIDTCGEEKQITSKG